ncbi:MAG: hypothetical protein ABIS86_10350 [Streptosporangiaceae bacterium]
MSDTARVLRLARIGRVARVIRLDARQGSLLAAIPVIAGIGTITAWHALTPGVADWDATVAATGGSVRWLGPVAAALAAWTAQRGRRLDYLRALAARSPAAGPLHDLLLLGSVSVLGYGLAALTLSGRTVLGDEIGTPHPVGLLAGAAAIVLHVVAGYLVGRLSTHPATVVLVATVAVAWAWLRPADSLPGLLPPAVMEPVNLFEGLRPGVLTAQLFWALGLTTALVLGFVVRTTGQTRLLIGVAAAVAVTVVCTVRLVSYGGRVTGPAPVDLACRTWPITVCVHPALRTGLPSLTATIAPLASRLAETPAAFTRLKQLPPWEPASVSGGTARFHLPDLSPGYAQRTVREITSSLTPRRCAGNPYNALVDAWLLDEQAPVLGSASLAFGRWSEAERRSWLVLRFAAYQSCTLSPPLFD